MITTTLHCSYMHINFYFQFQCESVFFFYNIKFISQKSNPANKFNVVKTTLSQSKIDMHIEQCNVVVITQYEIKTLEDMIS